MTVSGTRTAQKAQSILDVAGKSDSDTAESSRLRAKVLHLQRQLRVSPASLDEGVAAALSDLSWAASRVVAEVANLAASGDHDDAAGLAVYLEYLDRNLPLFQRAAERVAGGPLLSAREVARSIEEEIHRWAGEPDAASRLIRDLRSNARALTVELSDRDLLARRERGPKDARGHVQKRLAKIEHLIADLQRAIAPRQGAEGVDGAQS